jgi:hypothetical protein
LTRSKLAWPRQAQDYTRYYKLDCNDAVNPIVDALDQLGRGVLSFAFIDPTNWQVRFESLARLVEGAGWTC